MTAPAAKSDKIKMQDRGSLIINGRRYAGRKVYSNRKDPKLRYIYVPQEAKEMEDMLPQEAKAVWQGRRYRAELNFPVYEFYVESRADR